MSQVAMLPLTCLQRRQFPLILENVTIVYGVHLQLQIPVHIPQRQNKTCQHYCNNNDNDLYEYHILLQSRAIVKHFDINCRKVNLVQ